jgi:hypothetical protein
VGERAFFQIAVALIPLLTFGGLLVSSPKENNRSAPRNVRKDSWEAIGILVLGLCAIIAETTAIRGAVTASASTIDRFIVIGMIYVGMVAIVARAAAPRFARLLDLTQFEGTMYEPQARRWRRRMGVGIAALVAVTAYFSITGLNDAIRLGEGESRLHRVELVNVQMEASYRRLEAISRRKNAVLMEAKALADNGADLSGVEKFQQRTLGDEYKAALRAEKLEINRVGQLAEEQKHLYETAIP